MANYALLHFSYLQFLDLLTTLVFLLHGMKEGNPLVRFALNVAPNPLSGLLLVKLAAIGLGVFAWRAGRVRVLRRMNVLFAIVVAWNLAAMIVASAQ
jgi:hypothetical protein